MYGAISAFACGPADTLGGWCQTGVQHDISAAGGGYRCLLCCTRWSVTSRPMVPTFSNWCSWVR